MSYSINTKEKERTSLTVAMAATATRGITARMEQNSNYFDGGCHPTTMYWQPPQQQQQQQPLQQSLLQPKTGLVKPIPRRVAAAAAAVVPKRHLRTTDTSPSRSRCRMNRGRSRSPCRVGEFERTMTEAAVVASAGTTTSRVTPVAELFYGATEKAQIPLTRVHQAAQQSHDWESTWVHALHKVNPIDERRRHQQTEEEDDDRGFPYDATLEAYLSGDRVDGARNPSPSLSLTRTTSKEEEERLPLPVSTSLLQRKERLVQSPSAPPPQSKGPVQEAPYGRMVIAAAPGPVLCRPIALRVGQQPHPQQERSEHFTIPREIMDSLRGTGTSAIVDVSSSSSRRSLSPMTMFSNNTSRSSHNNGSWGEYVPLSSSSQSLQSQPGQYYPPQSQFAVEMQNGPHAAQPQPVLIEDDNDNEHNATTITTTTPFGGVVPAVLPTTLTMTAAVQEARDGMLIALAVSGGDTDTPQFRDCLSVLQDSFLERRRAAAAAADLDLPYADHEGTWLSLTKPTFFGCLGENDQNDPMYTIGRMTFDMFQPSNLICSLQGNFNVVERIDAVPDCLVAQVGTDASVLRTYKYVYVVFRLGRCRYYWTQFDFCSISNLSLRCCDHTFFLQHYHGLYH